MATTAAITLEELARMPEDGLRHEIDAGELIAERPPHSRHGLIKTRVAGLILDHVRHNQLGQTFCSTGFILGRNPEILRGPDVSFVRQDRLHDVPEDGWPELGPDLAIEIVSTADTACQMDRKMHQYLAAGTRAVWLVYPDTKSVHVFEPGGAARIVEFDSVVSSPAALAGFELAVRDIFE